MNNVSQFLSLPLATYTLLLLSFCGELVKKRGRTTSFMTCTIEPLRTVYPIRNVYGCRATQYIRSLCG